MNTYTIGNLVHKATSWKDDELKEPLIFDGIYEIIEQNQNKFFTLLDKLKQEKQTMEHLTNLLNTEDAFVIKLPLETNSKQEIITIKPSNGTDFTLDELKNHMEMKDDEYVESLTIDENWMLLCDEEGKLKSLPINMDATNLYNHFIKTMMGFGIGDYLVGNIIFMKRHLLK